MNEKPSARELMEQALLEQVASTAILVNEHGDILYLHGRTGSFLELNPGETGINNVLKMAREGLRHVLIAALAKAVKNKETELHSSLRVTTNCGSILVNLAIHPVTAIPLAQTETPLFLIILEKEVPFTEPAQTKLSADRQIDSETETAAAGIETDRQINSLKQELQAKEEYLRTITEELETSNEELKSSNEGMQSVNEELQSTNEELQSVNEELATVNTELQTKVADQTRANNDMYNLLAGTGIGTVFVDHRLHILGFTPSVTRIINLIQSDIGRPVGHIATNLVGYDNLVADTQAVLSTLVAREVEVQTRTGAWFTMRIHPYRTLDNVIEGAVITFVDITEKVLALEFLRKTCSQGLQTTVMQDSRDAMAILDPGGRILAWNPSAAKIYGWNKEEALGMNFHELIPEELREEEWIRINGLAQSEGLIPHSTQRVCKDGRIVDMVMVSTDLRNKDGQLYAIATMEQVRDTQST